MLRLLIFPLLLGLAACDGSGPEPLAVPTGPESIEVHFQSQFEDDAVAVRLGDALVFSSRVTTLDVLSLAATVPLSVPAEEQVVRVSVGGRAAALAVDPAATAVVAVLYDRATRRIELVALAEPPLYD